MTLIEIVKNKIKLLEKDSSLDEGTIQDAKLLYIGGDCQMISRGKMRFEFIITTQQRNIEFTIAINSETNEVHALQDGISYSWDSYVIACLYQLIDELNWSEDKLLGKGIKYTRDGMIQRVLKERKQRALTANYSFVLADNIYGEHTLINENGKSYKITLRDFENETGYIDSIDLRTNKLGTTKHIMWLFERLKQEPELLDGLENHYPFIEIFLDPANEYKITWFYPHEMKPAIKNLLDKYFGNSHVLADNKIIEFDEFINKAKNITGIVIRQDVEELVKLTSEHQQLLQLADKTQINFSNLRTKLHPYQEDGIRFATYRKGTIIADEFGLGKNIQAIGTAIAKKQILGFQKTLIICAASLKEKWFHEISAATNEKAFIVSGNQSARIKEYKQEDSFFYIISYEIAVIDSQLLSSVDFDLVILDDTQKIKNYQNKSTNAIKAIKRKHSLVLTDSPIDDKLIDLYSIVGFVDPYFLTPLWEFSYQHCLFDSTEKDKITGYYNLSALKKKVESILLRRHKHEVIKQLPNINEVNIPIRMHPVQIQFYNRFAHNLRLLIHKKTISQVEIKKILHQMNNLRMVCNSTHLVDSDNIISPKLTELRDLLTNRISINKTTKIICFSEWHSMNKQIANILRQENIPFIEVNSSLSPKNRLKLLDKYRNENYNILLTSDFITKELESIKPDFVINFEVPWNPEKRNNRIGQIDSISKSQDTLTIINLITEHSIETNIASGKLQKHGVFSEIFNTDSAVDFIDVEHPGVNQIIKELRDVVESEVTDNIDYDIFDLNSISDTTDNYSNINSEANVLKESTVNDDTQMLIQKNLENLFELYQTIKNKKFDYSNYKINYIEDTDEYVIRLKRS